MQEDDRAGARLRSVQMKEALPGGRAPYSASTVRLQVDGKANIASGPDLGDRSQSFRQWPKTLMQTYLMFQAH